MLKYALIPLIALLWAPYGVILASPGSGLSGPMRKSKAQKMCVFFKTLYGTSFPIKLYGVDDIRQGFYENESAQVVGRQTQSIVQVVCGPRGVEVHSIFERTDHLMVGALTIDRKTQSSPALETFILLNSGGVSYSLTTQGSKSQPQTVLFDTPSSYTVASKLDDGLKKTRSCLGPTGQYLPCVQFLKLRTERTPGGVIQVTYGGHGRLYSENGSLGKPFSIDYGVILSSNRP